MIKKYCLSFIFSTVAFCTCAGVYGQVQTTNRDSLIAQSVQSFKTQLSLDSSQCQSLTTLEKWKFAVNDSLNNLHLTAAQRTASLNSINAQYCSQIKQALDSVQFSQYKQIRAAQRTSLLNHLNTIDKRYTELNQNN